MPASLLWSEAAQELAGQAAARLIRDRARIYYEQLEGLRQLRQKVRPQLLAEGKKQSATLYRMTRLQWFRLASLLDHF